MKYISGHKVKNTSFDFLHLYVLRTDILPAFFEMRKNDDTLLEHIFVHVIIFEGKISQLTTKTNILSQP